MRRFFNQVIPVIRQSFINQHYKPAPAQSKILLIMAMNNQNTVIPHQYAGLPKETQRNFQPYVNKVFQSSDGDSMVCFNGGAATMEICVHRSILMYTNLFQGRAMASGLETLVPIFQNSVLQEIHDKALNTSKIFLESLCKKSPTVNNLKAKPKLEKDLEILFTLIGEENNSRKNILLKEYADKQHQIFQKYLQGQYEYLYEDQQSGSGKFYDQYTLDYFVKEIQKYCLDKIEAYAKSLFVVNEGATMFDQLMSDTIANARDLMTQECEWIANKNANIKETITKNMDQLLHNLEDGAKPLMKRLESNPFDKLEYETIRKEKNNCKRNIKAAISSNEMQNLKEFLQEFVKKVDSFWAKITEDVENFRRQKTAASMQKFGRLLPFFSTVFAKEDGVPREFFGETVKKCMDMFNDDSAALKAGGELKSLKSIYEDMDGTLETPGGSQQEASAGIDPARIVKAAEDLKRRFSDARGLPDDRKTNIKKTRPASYQPM